MTRPGRATPSRAAMLLGAVAVVGLLVGASLRGGGSKAARLPATAGVGTDEAGAPTVAPSPAATSPSAVGSPAPATDPPSEPTSRPGRRADVGSLAEQVVELRGLALRQPLRARLVPGAQLADKISALAFDDDEPEAFTPGDERLLVALRLAPEDVDLAALVERLYREQVLGLYVPEEATLYVRSAPGPRSPAVEGTTAHEIVHALQDQHFDLRRLRRRTEDDPEASAAASALVEGDAVLTQQLWSQAHQSEQERQRARAETAAAGGSALDDAPQYVRAALYFPYVEGARFVAALHAAGGYSLVDDAFADPPTTTEQVLHPDRYRAGEPALPARVTGHPGEGWRRDTDYPFGQFDLSQLLEPLGAETAARAAEGWGGGAVRSWRRGQDTATGLTLVMDTAGDALELCEAVPRWYASVADGRATGGRILRGDRDVLAYRCEDSTVAVGLAPDAATAAALLP